MEQAKVSSGLKTVRPRVFLSYKRNVEPDESLIRRVLRRLTDESYLVFVDQMIRASEVWAARIEEEIRQADWLILFLTEASSRSEMVRGEIEIARDEASKSGGRPRIVPVRINFEGRLPYPLNAYLEQIQYARWRSESDTERLLTELNAIMTDTSPKMVNPQDHQPRPLSAPPTYSAQLLPTGGTLDVEDPIYIVRRSEQKAVSLIGLHGQTIVVRGPRQIGKSSLLNRLAMAAISGEKKVALLDLQLFDESTRETPAKFFEQFLRSVCESLDLPEIPQDLYRDFTSPQACTSAMEKFVLKDSDKGILLGIDEVDRLFTAPYRLDFFGMLRGWHNRRAHVTKRQMWRNLDLVLVTATEPYMFIDVPYQSPFNVGEVLRLEDFSDAEVWELNRLHSSPLEGAGVSKLIELFGGHPYLTRRALYELAHRVPDTSPSELFDQAVADEGPFRDHLRHHCLGLIRQPQLASAFRRVVQEIELEDEVMFYRLEGAGLIRREKGRTVPRCHLYTEYFRKHLLHL